MTAPGRVRIKICCIMSEQEARLAVAHGADAIGLVGEMPSGPGVIDPALIARIAGQAPPPVATFLLTSRQTVASIVEQHRAARTTAVQICDRLPEGGHAELRRQLPGVKLVQVVHVTGPESVEEAVAVAPRVDALLLDSGNQSAPVKELGGTGRAHDWSLSRQICERARAPVFLAGGLRPDNVGRALDEVRPFGLDVCTGVRSQGALDPTKLDAFVRAVALATSPKR